MLRLLFIVTCLLAVSLAGCADEGPSTPGPAVDPSQHELAAGKGAITGLLVDDRFRPLHLTQEPETEFDADGFILVQETGDQLATTVNGEFTTVDLEPGTYTLRATIAGHEAAPQRVLVSAGEFAEVTMVARRVSTEGSAIITTEYTLFQFCSADVLVPLDDACLNADLSGDSGRNRLVLNYTAYQDTMTYLVMEYQASEPGDYNVWIGRDLSSLTAQYYVNEYVNGDYGKCVTPINNKTEEKCQDYTGPISPFVIDKPFDVLWWVNGEYDDETGTGIPITGVGAAVAIKGKFLMSAFLGEPEVDVDSYCLICGEE